MDTTMIKNILGAYGPSGREDKAAEAIKQYVAPYADEVYRDTMGNLIAHKRGTSGKKIMLSAHMDQIGFIVVAIDEKGFLRVARVGGVNPIIATAREVVFENGVKGVTYFENTAKHGVNEATFNELYIDIGCASREEAEKKVAIGDMAVYVTNYVELGERASCGAMDDRICCAIVAEAMKEMKSEHDVYAVFTVQEEVGCRGSKAAANAIQPTYGIACDVTVAYDYPGASGGAVSIGGGAAIKVKDSSVVCSQLIVNGLTKLADDAKIKYQYEVLTAGGTDTSSMQVAGAGCYAGCVSIPLRYVHTPIETLDKADLDACVALIREFIEKAV